MAPWRGRGVERENHALHCTEHLIPHFLLSSFPPHLPPILFYLTSLSMAGPTVEHATYHREMSTAPRGPPVGGW